MMNVEFRQRLLASTLLMGAAVFTTPAHAQTAPQQPAPPPACGQPGLPPCPQTDSVDLTIDPDATPDRGTDTIVVTGSRIPRRDLVSTSPLTVVNDEEFELSGAINVEQVLNTLPQVVPGVTGFSNNPGNGAVTLNLRNLGSARTLVLVNGRRWMFYDVSQIVDLNTIPQFMIDSVDVVTGGASAVYGSDAIAGVVNFRLRDDLEGVQLGTTYAITERGDGMRLSADLALGSPFADGRGHVTAFANYSKRKPIFQGDRNFSRFAAQDDCIVPGSTNRDTGIGQPHPSGAGTDTCIAEGGEVGLTAGGSFGIPTSALFYTFPFRMFTDTGGNLRDLQIPQELYNYAPVNYLQLPQERYLLGGYGTYDINDSITAFTELSFVSNVVAQELAATPFFRTVTLQVDSPFFSPATQAEFAALDGDGDGYFRTFIGRRFEEAGARNAENSRDAFRVLGGFKGNITPRLNWEAYYSYARTRNTEFQQGNVVTSRVLSALETEFGPDGQLRCRSATARAAGCVPLNLFGRNTASQEAVDYVTVDNTNQDTSELQVANAAVSGTPFNLGFGAPDVGFALGAEYRKMSARYIPDAFLAAGDVQGFNAGEPTSGSYNVKEVFGELSVPVLRDSFIHSLQFNAAARYSDYSLKNVGGVWTYAAGAELAPVRDITFRGQYQRAVRAPNVANLFGGNSLGFPGASDPCSDRGPADLRTEKLRQLCIASGVPAARVFTRAVQPNGQLRGLFGGNPDLGEETSDTYTLGAIIQPRFIPRLAVTVDYFNITVDDVIGTRGGGLNSALQLCYLVAQDLSNPICQIFAGTRSPGTGEIGREVAPVLVSDNLARLETSGVDFQVDYNYPLPFRLFGGDQSRLAFFFLGTWLDKYRSTAVADFPERTTIGEGSIAGNPLPEWRHTARFTYSDGPGLISLRWRYFGKVEDPRINNTFELLERVPQDPALFPNATIGSVNYFDLSFGANVTDTLNLTIGVNNLFDKKPEVLGDVQEQANTYPGTYDVLGRDYFITGRLRF